MPCLVTVSGYYDRRQGGYVSARVHLVVGGTVSRITQKLQSGFPLNFDGGRKKIFSFLNKGTDPKNV